MHNGRLGANCITACAVCECVFAKFAGELFAKRAKSELYRNGVLVWCGAQKCGQRGGAVAEESE